MASDKKWFDNEKYIKEQTTEILKRVKRFNNKLYLEFGGWNIDVMGVVITRFENQPSAILFKNKLERRNIKVYTHSYTKGYPTNVDLIVSDEGYGVNEHIKTEKPLVIVTGPGPGSGKL